MHNCQPICRVRGCWGECFICGFEYPIDSMQLHYKKERYVCCNCADCPSFSDYLEELEVPEEERCDTGGQQVSNQGGTVGLPTIVPPPELPPPPVVPPPPPPPTEVCDEGWNYIGRGIFYGFPIFISNTNWNIQANARGTGFVSVTGGGVLLDVDYVASPMSVPITITRFLVRCNEAPGIPCKCVVELYKNDVPTGMISDPVTLQSDKGFAIGSVFFNVNDRMNWKATLYDLDDNKLTVEVGENTADFPNASKWICVTFEYTAGSIYFIHPHMSHAQYSSLLETYPPYYTIPTNDILFLDSLTGGGFNSPTRLHNWTVTKRYARNFVSGGIVLQTLDGVNLSDPFTYVGTTAFPEPRPLTWNIEGPTTDVIDADIEAITNSNIDSTGRWQLVTQLGDVWSTLFGGAEFYYEDCFSYRFPDHPRSNYILAGHMSIASNISMGGIRRTPLCGVARSGLPVSRVATPLMTKGRFHHFAFWSNYVAVIGNIRCRLMIDGVPLFELTLLAGTRLTLYADMFICVDGELAWWEFTKLDGAPEPLNLGISCLLGPEGM